jgi:hypothetical protein
MTNLVGYKQYPNFEQFSKLYSEMTQEQLANFYCCNKKRINKWIKHFGLELRPQGGGNNRKYEVDTQELEKLLNSELSISEICETLNMKRSSLYGWMRKFGLKRLKDTTEFNLYKRKVRWETEKNYVLYKDIINPKNYPRTLCGVDGGYQLDHILGIFESYTNNIPIQECASLKNLQMIPWKQNLEKRNYNNYKKRLNLV